MPFFPRRVFPSRRFQGSSASQTLGARYRAALKHHPFALFGLPFMTTMVAGSFFLTPATAMRYERYDRKIRRMTKEEQLGLEKGRRKFDMKEEYYRLAAKDLDNWENRRVKRLEGEPDGVI
ncbi:MAG: Cytochrome oxidase assembly [Peltula sp. TS41687]|nr:MAG: Cytochrome oxidase assembly [Peltula sp. TS41687]